MEGSTEQPKDDGKAKSADRSYVGTTKGAINQDEVDKYRSAHVAAQKEAA